MPDEEEWAITDTVIFDELCQRRIEDSSHRTCIKIIARLIERGAKGIILGCTELPSLIRPSNMPVPLFDSTRLHAEAAVNFALAEY